MDFVDQLKQFAKRVESMKDSLQTEEATKTALIMPFFSMLGYDVFNPQEFVPEFTADVGIKKGEKVDYAILKDGEPVILVECKSITENLDRHDSQLFRYFGTTTAKFAILTNARPAAISSLCRMTWKLIRRSSTCRRLFGPTGPTSRTPARRVP